MAYNNFKKDIWSAHIQTEIEKNCVLASGCDYEFEGEVAHGKSVRILGVGRPEIGDYTGKPISAETVNDTSITMDINIAKRYFFAISDLDQVQSTANLMESLTAEGNKGLAETRDSYIAALAAKARYMSDATAAVDTESEAVALVKSAFKQLYKNGILLDENLELILSPEMYMLLEDKIIADDTDNSQLIRTGRMGKYKNATVLMTNNLYTDASGYTYCMLRTKKAIAFAGQLKDAIPTDLHSTGVVSDALLAVDVYGCRIVRQDEMYVIRCKEA
jgi:hypothetical protein